MGSPFEVLENSVITLEVFTGDVVANPITHNLEPARESYSFTAYLKPVKLSLDDLVRAGVNQIQGLYVGYSVSPKVLPDRVRHNSTGIVTISRLFTLEDGSTQESKLTGRFTLHRAAPKYSDQFTGSPISGILIAQSL